MSTRPCDRLYRKRTKIAATEQIGMLSMRDYSLSYNSLQSYRSFLSIVAVHGLNPYGISVGEHAKNTWTQPAHKDGHLWLRDDLSKRCPTARIFIYEYDANLVFSKSKEPFIHKANDFLEALRSERKKVLSCGHSLNAAFCLRS